MKIKKMILEEGKKMKIERNIEMIEIIKENIDREIEAMIVIVTVIVLEGIIIIEIIDIEIILIMIIIIEIIIMRMIDIMIMDLIIMIIDIIVIIEEMKGTINFGIKKINTKY